MADASLNIPITADASKFLSTLGQVEDRLKELKVALKDAVGADIGKINFEIQGLEQQKKSFKEFGKFAEGTYGRLLQQLDYLNRYKLTLGVDSPELAKTVAEINNIQETINKVNGKGIKIDVEIVQPPKGSIQYYEDRIKALRAERVVFAGDSTSLERANILIDEYTKRVSSLKTKGISVPVVVDEEIAENSILGLRKKIDELNAKKIRIGVTNQGEISKLNSEIKGLEQEIQKANNLTIDEKGGISKNANKARQTITNLKLVAQDLPFGFIAIQNNIPNLLESFGELNTKSGGLKGALKDLGTQLVGPAGIFLAFSVVTAGVTYAIQKYGSFGNAVDALFGKLDPLYKVSNRLNESIEKFNKEVLTTGEVVAQATASTDSQVIKMRQLSKAVLDTNNSEQVRKFALKEMKGIDEARFGRYDVEKGKLDGLLQSVNAYTQSIIANAVAQKLSNSAADALVVRNQALNLYETQRDKLEEIKKSYPGVIEGAKKYKQFIQDTYGPAEKLGKALVKAEPDVQKFIDAEDKTEASRLALVGLNKEYLRFRKGAIEATDESIKFGASLVDLTEGTGGGKVDFKFDLKLSDDYKEFIKYDSLDKALERLKQYGDTILDVNKSELERGKALKGLIIDSKSILGVNTQLFDGFKLGVTPIAQISDAIDNYGFAIQDLIINEKELIKLAPARNNYFESVYKTIAKGLTGGDIAGAIDTTGIDEAFNKIKEAADKLPKDVNASFGEFKNTFPTLDQFKEKVNEIIQLELFKTGNLDFSQISEIVNAELAALDSLVSGISKVSESTKFLKDQLQLAYTAINQVFFSPLENLFETFLTKGEIAFKDFTKAVGKSIADIAAKLAATGVIKGLLFLLDPSGALAGLGGSFGGSGAGNGILDALGGVFGRSQRKPDFNRVSPPRTYGGDRVEFTIRGTNLVGVLNRANGEINRIG
jgi:predicted DNA-binding ArsR family transcriptional regulator